MTIKHFCDHCKEEIDANDVHTRTLWSEYKGHILFNLDLCRKCATELEAFVFNFAPLAWSSPTFWKPDSPPK